MTKSEENLGKMRRSKGNGKRGREEVERAGGVNRRGGHLMMEDKKERETRTTRVTAGSLGRVRKDLKLKVEEEKKSGPHSSVVTGCCLRCRHGCHMAPASDALYTWRTSQQQQARQPILALYSV